MENKVIKCSICQSDALLVEPTCPSYQEGYTYQIYTCRKCNTSFSLPYIGADVIYNVIYKNANLIPGYSRYAKFCSEIKLSDSPIDYLKNAEETYFSTINIIKNLNNTNPNLKILEIGCGLGYFTYSLRRAGFDIIGLDISQEAINHAKQFFGDYYLCKDVFVYANETVHEFDVIVANQLIEHIENPFDFTKSLQKMLKPEGLIIYTTPNKSIYPKRAIYKTSDLPPIHCFWFSQESFVAIGSNLNMSVSFFDFSSWYKHNPKFIGFVHKNTLHKTQSVINKSGEVIKNEFSKVDVLSKKKITLLELFKKRLNTIRKSKLFLKWKYILFGYYFKCGKKGDVLCVMLNKV